MISVSVGVLYLVLPALVLYLCNRYQFLNRIGSIVLCYIIGLCIGVAGLSAEQFAELQDMVMNVTVPLAIPLLLFSSDVRSWKQIGSKPFYSLLFSLLAVFVAVILGFILFKDNVLKDFYKVGGMLVGIYSGGTPNLASLKMILKVEEEVYLAIHSYDMAIGAVYLFFLMGFGQRVFHWFLPRYKNTHVIDHADAEEGNLRIILGDKSRLKALAGAMLIAIVMVAIAGGAMMLVPDSAQMVVFIFLITSLGIGGSSFRRIKNTEGTFELGMYLILIFSIVVASKVQVGSLSDVNPTIFAYITFVVFVGLFLHVLLSRIKRIDADTVIVTSAALICSPPFVPVVAGSLRNRAIIVPGITIGLIGYALGNYLGYLVAMLLTLF
ncbi:MAG: DUF819 family protein [Carboxylicivirga sp.]|nr:DUF819 family protein [Carboxylicivirga sp.]